MTGKKNNLKNDATNPYQPSAPVSTGTIPRYSKPLLANLQGPYDVDEPVPSAPPLEEMDQVSGYELLTFNNAVIAPPSVVRTLQSYTSESNRPRPTVVSEKDAREALVGHVRDKWCSTKRVARDMSVTSLSYLDAFHFKLETFTEKRETCWKFVPYKGGSIDGVENGPAPMPWEIEATPSELFKDEQQIMRVPHTDSLKQCHACQGKQKLTCHRCRGKGWERCTMCDGVGTSRQSTRCFMCSYSPYGRGKVDCVKCHSTGSLICVTCDGAGSLLCYIGLTVTWKNNMVEHLTEENGGDVIPLEILRRSEGQVIYQEDGSRVLPLVNYGDESLRIACVQLLQTQVKDFRFHRILAQRQELRLIPVTMCNYSWKRKDGVFYICGLDMKVHAPDYPQTCCMCCCIL